MPVSEFPNRITFTSNNNESEMETEVSIENGYIFEKLLDRLKVTPFVVYGRAVSWDVK